MVAIRARRKEKAWRLRKVEIRFAERAAKARTVRAGRVRSVAVEERVIGLWTRELVEDVGEVGELVVMKARRSRLASE